MDTNSTLSTRNSSYPRHFAKRPLKRLLIYENFSCASSLFLIHFIKISNEHRHPNQPIFHRKRHVLRPLCDFL